MLHASTRYSFDANNNPLHTASSSGSMEQNGGGPGVDHGREPCPDRIIDDVGGAFGMGAVGGGLWHLVKGLKNSPSGSRLLGGVQVTDIHYSDAPSAHELASYSYT